MELRQDVLHLLRHGKPQVRRVLQQAHALIGEIKEDDRRAKHRAGAYDLYIHDVGDSHQQKDQYLPADSFKSHLTVELLVRYGAHYARDVVCHRKHHQGDDQPVIAAKEVAKPPSHSGEHHLDHIPKFLHVGNLRFSWFCV